MTSSGKDGWRMSALNRRSDSTVRTSAKPVTSQQRSPSGSSALVTGPVAAASGYAGGGSNGQPPECR